MPTFVPRYDLLAHETLGLRSRDPMASVQTQRNIDEIWRQVAALRELAGANEDALNAVRNQSRPPGTGAGDQAPSQPGSPSDPGSEQPAYQWILYNAEFASEDGTGYSTASRVSTVSLNPWFDYRFLALAVYVDYELAADSPGTGGVYLNIGGGTGGDVLQLNPWNRSTLQWKSGIVQVIDGNAIEGGGRNREFSAGQQIRIDHRPSHSPAGGVRVRCVAQIYYKTTVRGT